MIIRIGGISVNLLVRENAAGPRTDRIMEGLRERLSHFIVRGGRHDFSLVIRPVDDLPWGEILRSEDLVMARRIVRILKGRFPFTEVPFEGRYVRGHKANGSSVNGKAQFGLLARFDGGDISVIPQRWLLLAVDHTRGHGEVIVKGGDDEDIIPSVVNGLQGALSICAPEQGGVLLHASSLVINGGGYAFLGGSGAGKSTVAASMSPETILADDGTYCSRVDGGFYLSPTPFSTMEYGLRVGVRVPVRKILFLEKDTDDFTSEISCGRAMTTMLCNHIHFFRFMCQRNAVLAFRIVEELCRSASLSTLHFTRRFNPGLFFREVRS